jgi:hypothetical protein
MGWRGGSGVETTCFTCTAFPHLLPPGDAKCKLEAASRKLSCTTAPQDGDQNNCEEHLQNLDSKQAKSLRLQFKTSIVNPVPSLSANNVIWINY